MRTNVNAAMDSQELMMRMLTIFAVGLVFSLLMAEPAFATGLEGPQIGDKFRQQLGAAAGGMPWEGPLRKIQEALTGGAARALAIIAMAVAGGMLAFGGELSEFAKRICMVVIAAATMIGAANIISLAIPG